MLRIATTLLLSLAVLVATAPPVAAHSVSGSYTLGATPGVSIVCSPNCLGLGANLGGYQFPSSPEIPAHVAIADASGANVPYTVCQDLNADSVCGNNNPSVGALEPRADGCGKQATLTGFRTGFVTSVFVRVVENGCAGGATSGTITLTYST